MTKTIGRNDKCPCGSGLKFKKCHMIIQDTIEREQNEIDSKWLEADLLLGQERLKELNGER